MRSPLATVAALPRRTIRLRLTAIYAVVFLLSGAGLLTITYVLVENHLAPAAVTVRAGSTGGSGEQIIQAAPLPGAAGSPSCVTAGAGPLPDITELGQCAFYFRNQAASLRAQVAAQRSDYLNTLLIGSGIALAVMTLAALGAGWLMSGRVLRPLRTIIRAARNISASNLHERLALSGPDDELKELGDTVDALLSRLESSFAAQRQFVANASHELRTPLARQRTLMEVALSDPGRSLASLEAACGRVLAAGQQQERLIEGMLTLARSQRGLDHFEPVDLAAVATEQAQARSADARDRDIRIHLAISPAVFAGDVRLTERLVSNLLDNAIRHNHDGGLVIVRTATEGGEAVLAVANSGPVLDQAEVPGLFEPFRHRGISRASGADSPGLGLSIVRAITIAHGAVLGAFAQSGGGLDVRVRFGCQPRPLMPAASASADHQPPALPFARRRSQTVLTSPATAPATVSQPPARTSAQGRLSGLR